MRTSVLILALSSLLLPCSGLPTATGADPDKATHRDWPQWRGANRDAVSPETGLVARWPEGGPRVVWRSKIGAGFSSVSISDGKAYTLWDEKGTQFVFCLDALTGEERWRYALGPKFTHHYGDGPRSTPLIDEGIVYAIGTPGRLVALDADTGKPIWQHDLVQELAATLPSYGFSSSPLIVGDKVVIEAGGKNATFAAYDRTSGKLAWTSEDDRPAYSSPIAVSLAGVEQIVFWSAHGLHAVSPDDGKVLWRFSWENFCPVSGDPLNTGTPLFLAPDRIFISSGKGAAVVRVSRVENRFKVETVWESQAMRSDVNTALLLGDHIYGFDRGILKCVDAGTGEIRWKARGFERGSLIAADGKLIILGESGNLALVEANPEKFVEASSVQLLKGRNWTAPSLATGKLYLRNHEELICLDISG